jgi:1-acyl-sn-glycerol-3-phosphate acyltransferase
MLYAIMKHAVLGPPLQVLYRPHVEGIEHIPSEGPAILASNHLSFSDSIFLPLVVDRKITFLAKAEYFNSPGVKGWLTKQFMESVGQVPIDRTGGRASMAAIDTGVRVLREGHLLGVYPEGTRSPDGRLYRGRTGPARMALAAPAPVIPVAMIGTDKIQPTGQRVPNLHPLEIRIGTPLDFSRYAGMEDDRYVLRSMTDEIMYALMELSGQEYVDIYASTAKERIRKYGTSTPTKAQIAAAKAKLSKSA